MSYCKLPGCSRPATGWSGYCNSHRSRLRRHGDVQQDGVIKAQLKPYVQAVRRRIAKNADNPVWKTMEARWQALVDLAHAELTTYRNGAPHVRQHRQAYEEVERLAGNVEPRAVVETALALYLMADQDPRRFRSDEAFRYQLARRLRALTEANRGSWYDHQAGRVKKVYRDTPPKATDYLADLLVEVFGAAGLYLAQLERTQTEAKREQAKALWDELQTLT